jgi:hypothetical protein
MIDSKLAAVDRRSGDCAGFDGNVIRQLGHELSSILE